MTRILIFSALLLALDQLTKLWVVEILNLRQKRAIDVFPPFINFRMAWNEGINFGLLSGLDIDAMRWVLIGVALVVAICVLWWGRTFTSWFGALLVAMIVGGAIGNSIDRIRYGAVADFLNMSCCGYRNPFSFNVADITVFLGVIGLVLFSERLARKA
ncbi:MAG: signal peptidase II [Rhodobacteraceae bacterium]|nr:signal peptidase II [Paracoccaceae bacterium]